ncbi:MAG: hypothetical protein K2K70_04170 [Lachnospiraceae bacterium]|nr:hypothetical protein [Lachnospiraceae bacterium]
MNHGMEILLDSKEKPEMDKITSLIKEMSDTDQDKMLFFLQGVRFAKGFQNTEQKDTATSRT